VCVFVRACFFSNRVFNSIRRVCSQMQRSFDGDADGKDRIVSLRIITSLLRAVVGRGKTSSPAQ